MRSLASVRRTARVSRYALYLDEQRRATKSNKEQQRSDVNGGHFVQQVVHVRRVRVRRVRRVQLYFEVRAFNEYFDYQIHTAVWLYVYEFFYSLKTVYEPVPLVPWN